MSNRLEQEFPEVGWQTIPPTGPGGVRPEMMREYLERGRQLHSQAMRNGLRAGGAAVIRALVLLAALIQRAARGPARRPPEGECWSAPRPCI
jgi:hypothetical protein